MKIRRFLLSIAFLYLVTPAHAALTTYSAFDSGASDFAAATNSQAEAALFDAQASSLACVINTVDFSGVSGADDSRFLAIPEAQLAPGVSISITDGDPSTPDGMLNTSGGIADWGSPTSWSQTSPEYILFGEFGSGEPASALTFNFTDPVNFFGAYYWLGEYGPGTLKVNFDNGSSQTINLPSAPSGIGFAGFVDDTNLIASVEFRTDPVTGLLNLGVALDDVRFGKAMIEVDIDIKFCSDPNAFNCKKKGKLPVTIFGTDSFDVGDINISTLQLCTEDLSSCTSAPRDWSFADRGTPTDAGAAQCALVEDPPLSGNFVEQDYLNQDTFLDLDVAFDAIEVQDNLETFCSDEKGTISEPLIITGTLIGGNCIYSVPEPNVGIDQLLKVNK